ncbi:hypothetical protein Dimus_013312 [Dionaea muscipula]
MKRSTTVVHYKLQHNITYPYLHPFEALQSDGHSKLVELQGSQDLSALGMGNPYRCSFIGFYPSKQDQSPKGEVRSSDSGQKACVVVEHDNDSCCNDHQHSDHNTKEWRALKSHIA